MEGNSIKIKSKEGDIIEFREDIINLSPFIEMMPSKSEVIELNETPSVALNFIKSLLETHDYKEESMTWVFPFKNGKLKEHIDEISYQFFSQFDASGKTQEEVLTNSEIYSPYLEAIFLLDIKELKKISNITLQIPFYCPETESDIQEFKLKWGILDNEETEALMQQITEENAPIFDKISSDFRNQIDELLKKEEEISLALQPQQQDQQQEQQQ